MTLLHFALAGHCQDMLEMMLAFEDIHAVNLGRVEQIDHEDIVGVAGDIHTFPVDSTDIPEPACGTVEVQNVDALPAAPP